MKRLDLCGLGNALVDVLVKVDEATFSSLNLEKGSMRLVSELEQQEILTKIAQGEPELVSGGSVANSVIATAALGAKSAFMACIGDDEFGLHYSGEFKELSIDLANPLIHRRTTGTSLVIITPEGERTMQTTLGVCNDLNPQHISEDCIKDSKWLFIEGYPFLNGKSATEAIYKAIKLAKAAGTRIAITASEAFVVENCSEDFFAAVKEADLLFANAAEVCAVSKKNNFNDAINAAKDIVPNLAITNGSEGVVTVFEGERVDIPAFPAQVEDLTGAGDMFAGTFLYGLIKGYEAKDSAKRACFMASKVIEQVGARLRGDLCKMWETFDDS